jgi:hypothetical protein
MWFIINKIIKIVENNQQKLNFKNAMDCSETSANYGTNR